MEETNSFTSYQTDSEGYINEITLTITKKNSLSYRFYEISEVNTNDFSLVE